MGLSKAERLQEFYRRLSGAPAGSSAAEALELVRKTLNAVEDELSGVPYNIATWRTDGRMYPPLDDAARPDRPGVTRYRSLGHNTYIGANGSIEIRSVKDNAVMFGKPGQDGKELKDL